MNVEVGSLVYIEGSDTLWRVLDINKGFIDVENADFPVVQLYELPEDEVLGVVEE